MRLVSGKRNLREQPIAFFIVERVDKIRPFDRLKRAFASVYMGAQMRKRNHQKINLIFNIFAVHMSNTFWSRWLENISHNDKKSQRMMYKYVSVCV